MDRIASARFVPPSLLVVVAIVQIVLARTGGLTPWKGGGFGMFSTLDHGEYRPVDIVVDAPDRSESLEIPASLDTAAARVSAYPADWLMQALAEGVAAREKRYRRPISRVTLTMWRTDFDRETLHSAERQFRSFVYAVP